MKNVLYLRTDICEVSINVGGSIGHTLGVIRILKKKYKVFVFSSFMKQVLVQEKDIIFNVFSVWPVFLFLRWRFWYLRWRLESFLSTIFFFLQLLPIITNKTFKFVYQRYSILNATGVLVSWYKKIPLILEYNGSEAYWFDASNAPEWYKRWFSFQKLSYWIESLNLKYAHQIVAVSQALKDDLVMCGIDPFKILVNPNGVEEVTFNGKILMKERITIRELYSLENTFVFGFIGTFGHWHGIPMLEKIIPIICDKYSNARFLLIGDGTLKVSLEQNLKKYIDQGLVILTGKIEQHLAPEYLAACDAYLCPTAPNTDGTRFFGSPTKLFEYMSMAKPIIASDLEQLSEIIFPAIKINKKSVIDKIDIVEQIGLLVPPLDVQGFAKACELCLSFTDMQVKKIGKNARAKVLERYTWQKHVEHILSAIK